ncbi:acyltransferase ChoActase/COT/CPT [Papiliotrema laurentii]|uniref:Carnitine O-acetyltransferase, mitochondrial n=1 Tax=Papiliotrema laurentii TaxID=5418 RepID=A0AAD9FMU9_PAPLA|nr:acyltransferase ChoActase/COT/CPT [Papiliotrema laurentii]
MSCTRLYIGRVSARLPRSTLSTTPTSTIMTTSLATRALSSSPSSSTSADSHPKPLYASQPSLPHLPVPTLSSTLHKYIETLQPLQTPEEHQKSRKTIESFLSSATAKTLQQRLEARAAERDSWLSEWWNDAAYMGYRGRIVPNVSYFYVHKHGLGKGKNQAQRAAELVRATVEFKKLVDSERLEPEKVKGKPLCMASYKYLFNAVRVPTSPADVPLAYEPEKHHHIVVLSNDRYFKVDTKGRSASDLVKAFEQIKKLSADKPGSGVGVLTADDRDVWTEARRHLLSISNKNVQGVQDIESAILLVCLDNDPAPATEDARAWAYWAGGHDRTGKGKGFNRWFDKHEIIVDSNGESGFNGEHSMLDGTPTLRLNEFMLGSIDKGAIPLELPEGEKSTEPMPAPEEIVFELDKHLQDVVAKSKKGFEDEMALQDLKMVNFTGYGKEVIKTHKTSPDAWAQLIKQLAFYRLFNRPGVTYESCQTRQFLLGRTEVIRSVSNEAKAFVEAMADSSKSDAEREKLFRAAVTRHIQYSAWAADAQGVDRHLSLPTPAFAKSSHWEMSTSQLSSKYLDGWGYGEVVEDGYGLSYAIGDNEIRWCVTTKNNDAEKFGKALVAAAEDVRKMMDNAKKSGSKL